MIKTPRPLLGARSGAAFSPSVLHSSFFTSTDGVGDGRTVRSFCRVLQKIYYVNIWLLLYFTVALLLKYLTNNLPEVFCKN